MCVGCREQLAGKNAIVRYLVRSAHSSQLAGSSVLASVQVSTLLSKQRQRMTKAVYPKVLRHSY